MYGLVPGFREDWMTPRTSGEVECRYHQQCYENVLTRYLVQDSLPAVNNPADFLLPTYWLNVTKKLRDFAYCYHKTGSVFIYVNFKLSLSGRPLLAERGHYKESVSTLRNKPLSDSIGGSRILRKSGVFWIPRRLTNNRFEVTYVR